MASLLQWIIESTPASTTLPPAPVKTAAQSAGATQQFPPWNTAAIIYQPQPPVAGSLQNPYIYPLAPAAQPTPPAGITAIARGPQTPPMGPFGAGAGGVGVAPSPPITVEEPPEE